MQSVDFSGPGERIWKEIEDSGIPSMAVAVARNGEMLWEEAFGWADRAKRIPATIDTIYCLASVSKPVTATALMKLVEQGKVELDGPVNDYLGRDSQLTVWVGDAKAVTVRRVANHTAGLPLHSNFYGPDDRCPKPPMEETIRRYGNVVTPAGERYRYSNLGYGILAYLIERVSGVSYADFLRREIFRPLGMTRSVGSIVPELADVTAVRYGEGGEPVTDVETDHGGASCVCSSVHDLVRFGMFHLKQALPDAKPPLSDESIDAMQVPTADMRVVRTADRNLHPGSKYGIGWVIDDNELDYRVSHGGGMGGAATKLLLLPRKGIVVAVLSNLFHPFAYTIERDILSALLPGYADRLAAYETDKADAAPDETPPWLEAAPELVGDWSGTVHTYEKDLPLTLSFKSSGDIHAKVDIQQPTLVNDASFFGGRLSGKMAGNVFTSDTTRRPRHPFHHLELDLTLRGDTFNGAVMAIAGCALNHWVELKRVKGES